MSERNSVANKSKRTALQAGGATVAAAVLTTVTAALVGADQVSEVDWVHVADLGIFAGIVAALAAAGSWLMNRGQES